MSKHEEAIDCVKVAYLHYMIGPFFCSFSCSKVNFQELHFLGIFFNSFLTLSVVRFVSLSLFTSLSLYSPFDVLEKDASIKQDDQFFLEKVRWHKLIFVCFSSSLSFSFTFYGWQSDRWSQWTVPESSDLISRLPMASSISWIECSSQCRRPISTTHSRTILSSATPRSFPPSTERDCRHFSAIPRVISVFLNSFIEKKNYLKKTKREKTTKRRGKRPLMNSNDRIVKNNIVISKQKKHHISQTVKT